MLRNTQRLSRRLAAAIAVTAMAVPSISPADQDLRNPDTRDVAASAAQREQAGYQDLRNPDNRSPTSKGPGDVVTERVQPPEVAREPSFDWGDAAVGGGTVLGLVLVVISAMFTLAHRRTRRIEG